MRMGIIFYEHPMDISPMTTFREHAEAYQHSLDLAADDSVAEGIRQGLQDLRAGRSRPALAVFDDIRADYGIAR